MTDTNSLVFKVILCAISMLDCFSIVTVSYGLGVVQMCKDKDNPKFGVVW